MSENEQQEQRKSNRGRKPGIKEMKPRKPGGGRKLGQKDKTKRITHSRRPGGGRKPAEDRTRTLTLKVRSSWWYATQEKAKEEGISMASYCRKLLHADLK